MYEIEISERIAEAAYEMREAPPVPDSVVLSDYEADLEAWRVDRLLGLQARKLMAVRQMAHFVMDTNAELAAKVTSPNLIVSVANEHVLSNFLTVAARIIEQAGA